MDSRGGEWLAGLIVGKRRKCRLVLDESRINAFTLPLTDPFDEYANEMILTSDQIQRLATELSDGRADVSGWQLDYANALLRLCEAAIAIDTQLYYVGP
jgi:hypothetical protein